MARGDCGGGKIRIAFLADEDSDNKFQHTAAGGGLAAAGGMGQQ